MGMTSFKKIIIAIGGVLSLCGALALRLSSLMIHRFTVNYGEILKKTEENAALIERKLIDADTPSEDKEFLLRMMTLYSLSKESMEYYKIEDIDEYMELQSKIYKLKDVRENYGRYSSMKENKEKLKQIVNL